MRGKYIVPTRTCRVCSLLRFDGKEWCFSRLSDQFKPIAVPRPVVLSTGSNALRPYIMGRRMQRATLGVTRSAGDEAWRRGENMQACRAALGLKTIARADHHDILEKRRLGNADADSTRASESRRSHPVEFYWSQTSSTAPIFSLEI